MKGYSRFKLSGITNPSGTANFQWRTSTPNNTILFSYASADPWSLSEITSNPINPSDIPLPVELQSFEATIDGNTVVLEWITVTEMNNYSFDIERMNYETKGNHSNWEKLGFIEGHGNSNSLNEYSFTDHSIVKTGKYKYRLKQINTDGSFEYYAAVSVEVSTPNEYILEQNYPNPFNPSTTIVFTVPETNFTTLEIFNLVGQKITILFNGVAEQGKFYKFEFDASNFSSGIYIYRIQSGENSSMKKMMLMK